MDKPSVSLDGIEVDIRTFPDRSVGLREYLGARANTAGFQALYPKLTDEALLAAVENALKNCATVVSPTTYEEVHVLVTELLQRFRERIASSL
ncbi:MAG: hypothetical protein OWT27_09005 [Firmicutes bacterium]|nr:hypothetical protein [Bacillota bacterium]